MQLMCILLPLAIINNSVHVLEVHKKQTKTKMLMDNDGECTDGQCSKCIPLDTDPLHHWIFVEIYAFSLVV